LPRRARDKVLDELRRLGGSACYSHLQAALFQQRLDEEADHDFVFDDQDRGAARAPFVS